MKPDIIANYVRKYLIDIVKDLEIKTINWHLKGYQKGFLKGLKRELREFAGRPEELMKYMKDVEILIVHVAPVTKEVIEASEGCLRIIGCTRGGVVNVDIDAATMYNIPVLNTPGRNAIAVAEFTIGLIIALTRNIARAHALLTKGIWRDEFNFFDECGQELHTMTLGIIGLGNIGTEVAKRAKALGMKVIYYDIVRKYSIEKELGIEYVDLNTLLRTADCVSIHVRLTPQTYHMISEKELKLMKPTAILINTSRGSVIDEKALVKALRNKWIAGAALDVYEIEPLTPDNPLLTLDNVLLTPHMAGATKNTVYRASEMIAQDIRRLVKGEDPKHCVNPEVLPKFKELLKTKPLT